MRLYGLVVLAAIYFVTGDSLNIYQITQSLSWTLLIALSAGIFGLSLMYYVLEKMDMANFAITKSISPVVTVILGYILLGERFSLQVYVGGFLVVAAVLAMNYMESKKEGD